MDTHATVNTTGQADVTAVSSGFEPGTQTLFNTCNLSFSELEFPSSLTSEERAYIHRLTVEFGLKSKSRGKGASRYLTVYKREGSTIMQSDATLQFCSMSKKYAMTLLNQFPVTNKERQDLLPPTDRERNPYLMTEGKWFFQYRL